jgi:hypothetical protein
MTPMRDRRSSLATSAAFAIALAVTSATTSARAEDEIDASSLRAEKLADQAFGHVARGEYAQAVDLYVKANEAVPSAILSFDVAWLYDKSLASSLLALEWYRRALAMPDVTPELRARAAERITAIEAERAANGSVLAKRKVSPPPGGEGQPADGSWSPLRTWAILAGGTGVVALGIGVGFAVVAKTKDTQAGRYCDGDRCTEPRALTLTDEATSAATIANVAVVTGAVFVAGGITLWLLAPRRGAVDVGVRASAGGPSIVLGGTLP